MLLLLILLSSCAAVKYGVNLEIQQTTYNSVDYQVSSTSSLNTERIDNGQLKGKAYSIGLTEETKYIITRINYITGKVSGDYNSDSTQLTETGYLSSLGLKVLGLQPRVVFGTLNYKSSDGDIDKQLGVTGYGLAYEIDIGKAQGHHIYFAFDQLNSTDAGDVSKLSFGYRIDLAKYRGSKN